MKKAIFYYIYAKHLYLFILPKFGAKQKGNANSLTNNSKNTFGGLSGRIFTTILYIYLGRLQLYPSAFSLKLKKSFSFRFLSQGMCGNPSYHLCDPPEVFLYFPCISLFWWSQPRLGTPEVASWLPSKQQGATICLGLLAVVHLCIQLALSPQECTAPFCSTKNSSWIHWHPLALIKV